MSSRQRKMNKKWSGYMELIVKIFMQRLDDCFMEIEVFHLIAYY